MSLGYSIPAGEPQAINPENGLSRKVVGAIVTGVAIALGLAVWFLPQLSGYVIHNERVKKIQQALTPMVLQLWEDEARSLEGVDAAIRKLAK